MGKRSFRQWLATFKHVENPIGDLARDLLVDPDLYGIPITEKTVNQVYSHIKRFNSLAADTFKKAWRYYWFKTTDLKTKALAIGLEYERGRFYDQKKLEDWI